MIMDCVQCFSLCLCLCVVEVYFQRLGVAYLLTGAAVPDMPAAHLLNSSTLRTPVFPSTRCQIDYPHSLWYLPQVPQFKLFLLHLNSPHCFQSHSSAPLLPSPLHFSHKTFTSVDPPASPLPCASASAPAAPLALPLVRAEPPPATYSPEQLNKVLFHQFPLSRCPILGRKSTS